MRKIKVWSNEDLTILRHKFPTTITEDLEPILGCSKYSIARKAGELGIKKDPRWLTINRRAAAKKDGVTCFKNGNKPWNYKGNTNEEHKDSRPRAGSVFTGHGYQDIQVVPGGRILTHKISDVSVREK